MMVEHLKSVNLDNKTVRRILAAALDCWTRDGYHGASLMKIAEQAGVAKSLLHYHFSSKEHLLVELQAVYFRRVAADVRARLATRTPSIDSALQTMDQVFEIIVESQTHFPFALEVWRASLHSPEVRARIVEFERDILGLFREGVIAALGPLAGRLRLSPDRLAELLQVVFGGFELRLFLVPDVERLRRVFEDFKMLVQLGVLAPQPGGSS